MTIMYVDDSGSHSYKDHTNYFILAGIIVIDDKIKNLQKITLEYKHSIFDDEFVDSEIHAHHIYRSRGDFQFLDYQTKIKLLDGLYKMIYALDCVGIIIVINKNKLKQKNPKWDVFNTAWLFLLDAYEAFLQENSFQVGKIKVDKSSGTIQKKTNMIIHTNIKARTGSQKISRIKHVTFDDSSGVFGIQIADAFAYCALKHKMNDELFVQYWNVVYNKLVKNACGKIPKHGYIEYP